MKPNLSSFLPAALMLGGSICLAWGLHAPLAKFPLIGSVSFSQPDFGGGAGLTWALILLSVLAALLPLGGGAWRRIGWLSGGGALGLLAGTLLIRRAWVIDKIQQLADATGQLDAGVETLLAKMETGTGAFALGCGVVLWLCGLLWSLIASRTT